MRKSIPKLALTVVCVSIFANACGGATGPSFKRAEVSKSESVIYIYRTEDECLGDKVPEVFLDDKSVGGLKNGGYLVEKVETKVHTVRINAGDNMDLGMYVDPGAGEERFVKWIPVCQEQAGTATTMANMKEVEAEDALGEISATKLSR
jgi:hypothetical protein